MDRPSLFYRLHEWAADNFKSVQYPNVSVESGGREIPRRPFFKNQMPLYQRFGLIVLGVVGLMVGLTLLVVILGFAWALITA